MANLHTISPVYSSSLLATLTSWSDSSFFVLIHIHGIPEPILTLIDSGTTSNFINLALASMSIFVTTALAQPITLSLFDGKPATSGFIQQSVSTSVQFVDESTMTLNLLVTQLHPSAPIVLGLPWLWSTNPVMDWLDLTLAFRSGLKSSLPSMMVAMPCATSALCHEDVVLHIPPLFVSIPKLHYTDTSKPEDMMLSAEPNFPADNSTHLVAPKFMDDSNPLPVAPKFTDDPNPFPVTPKFMDDPNPASVTPKFTDDLNPTPVAPKFRDHLDTYPVDPNFTDKADSLRDLTTSGYVLNMAPTELNSAVLTPSALGSSFYDISSQLSLNLSVASQKSIFVPVQIPYEPSSLISGLYSSLNLPEEVDTILFRRWEPSVRIRF